MNHPDFRSLRLSLLNNLLLRTDSYKHSHHKQYPPKTSKVRSYIEARGGEFPETLFFGLQYYLQKYLQGSCFSLSDVQAAEMVVTAHMGPGIFNQGWYDLYNKHHGKLPVEIKAVAEGTLVPTGNVLVTIENTDDEFPWLTNFLESLLLKVWYPTTVATLSYACKRIILSYLEKNGDPDLIGFKLHDFGYRGTSSEETASIGAAAHLINFLGTDTLVGLIVALEFYNASAMPGFSIPAAEHSTITSWGKENEAEACENMLTQYPSGLVAVVSDSYDIYDTCKRIWGELLKDKVLERDGTLVVRPDSGDPKKVLVELLKILGDAFGYTVNEKGYRVLNPKIRMIWGDGINLQSLGEILEALDVAGWSADNVAFGMGGGLLQMVNRDTSKFATKCSSAVIDGKECDVFKDPVTDPGKKSKRGNLALVFSPKSKKKPGVFATKRIQDVQDGELDMLIPVFRDGQVIHEWTFEQVRSRTAQNPMLVGIRKGDNQLVEFAP